MRKLLQFALLSTLLVLAGNLRAQDNVGIASYYSDSFQGRKTASEEKYDKDKLTAAHKTLPFGTYLKITRLDNKKSVIVKVNDRGPYIKGRIVDLSRKAADMLDIVKDGHANVKIEVVSREDNQSTLADNQPAINMEVPEVERPRIEDIPVSAENNTASSNSKTETATPVEKKSPLIVTKPVAATPEPPVKPTVVANPPKPASAEFAPGEQVVRGKDYNDYDLYKIQVLRPERTGYGVQVASLTKYENVLKQVAELQEKWFNNILVSVEPGEDDKPVYKTILGPFPDRATALSYQKELKKKKGISGFIVELSTISYTK